MSQAITSFTISNALDFFFIFFFRSGSDIAVAQDDDVSPTPNEGDEGDEERVTEIATLVAEIGKIMSTAILK